MVEMMRQSIETIERLSMVRKKLSASSVDRSIPKLIAVSKTLSAEHIRPVLEAGQYVFGENRVQEAKLKWPPLRADFPALELHLIGPLQSGKVREAVFLFDVIHTVDRPKIAKALADEMSRSGKLLKLFIQVNTGEEPQKSGILPHDIVNFVTLCQEQYGLIIEGLMCIPPIDDNPALHFAFLHKMAKAMSLPYLSMGMSLDYEQAVAYGATHVRIGSAIFGDSATRQVSDTIPENNFR